MTGIKDGSMNVIKGQILANAEVRQNFNMAVNFHKDYIHQERTQQNPSFQVAAVYAEVPKPPGKQVEDRYYTTAEYRKLTKDQKEQLSVLRKQRNKYKGGRKSGKTNHKRLKHQIATIVAEVLELRDRGNEGLMTNTQNASTISNRTHPALTRQGRAPKRK